LTKSSQTHIILSPDFQFSAHRMSHRLLKLKQASFAHFHTLSFSKPLKTNKITQSPEKRIMICHRFLQIQTKSPNSSYSKM
jgi:ribosomal protein S12